MIRHGSSRPSRSERLVDVGTHGVAMADDLQLLNRALAGRYTSATKLAGEVWPQCIAHVISGMIGRSR